MSYTTTLTDKPAEFVQTSIADVKKLKSNDKKIEATKIFSLDDEDDCEDLKIIHPNQQNPIFNTLNLNVVEHPDHYGAGNGVQCIEAMLQTFGKEATMAFCKLNSFKYIWRSDHKAKEVQDMEKAKRYLEYWHVLNKLQGNEDDGSFHEYLNS